MTWFDTFLGNLPEVTSPTQKKLGFKEKAMWTIIILVLFFVLGIIPLYGLGQNSLSQFEFLSVILGASFGSIISLGIGPIVTASIILQLLNGSGLFKFDLSTHEGKQRFQGLQKLFSIGFIIIEAFIYVNLGGLRPQDGISPLLLIFQLLLGGLMIMFMDEVISKWGFGSGISLFIAAGVSQTVFTRLFSFLHPVTNGVTDTTTFIGAIPEFINSLSLGRADTAGILLGAIVATILVFLFVVYTQAMKVEIPLSFGRLRGHGIRWPLNFIYTSNIPVILVAALLANIHLFANLFTGDPNAAIIAWVTPPNLLRNIIAGNWVPIQLAQGLTYMVILMAGSVLFSWFWVQTSGLDAKSQAKQLMSSGLQVPGFRKDQRVMERLLQRYITPLTVMGGLTVGFIAAVADLSGVFGSGTGILLTVMIVYKLYEDLAKQHMMDMNPMMRKFMGG